MYRKNKAGEDRSLPSILVCAKVVSEDTRLDCAFGDRGCARTLSDIRICSRARTFPIQSDRISLSVSALTAGKMEGLEKLRKLFTLRQWHG